MRSLRVLALATTLGAALPIGAHPTGAERLAATPATITQSFTGGGNGTSMTHERDWQFWQGEYTSTGQLGDGRYVIGAPMTTVEFTRSDGMRLAGDYDSAPPGDCGANVTPDVECIAVDLAGAADIARAHLVIAIQATVPTDAVPYSRGFLMRGTLTLRQRIGYAMVDANGTTYQFGGTEHRGDASTVDATDIQLTGTGPGYWIVDARGTVTAFGDAPALSGAPSESLAFGERVTSMSVTPTKRGYWLFTSEGRALPFGDAKFLGDLRGTTLNGDIVGSIATPTGGGYYMVGSDGGVFAFGDARFRGSMGNIRLNQPVVGLVPSTHNSGYWLVACDGGVFSFDAPFLGSMGGVPLNRPVVSMVPYGGGYLMIASDGGVFNFSTAPFLGSLGGTHLAEPIVAGAAIG